MFFTFYNHGMRFHSDKDHVLALGELGYPIYGFLQVFRAGGDQYHITGVL